MAETKNVLGCASNAGEHGWPDKSTQKDGALHVEKTNPRMRTEMTPLHLGPLACWCAIPFLRTCIINMIADLEKRFTSDGNKRRTLVQPETPWK